MMKWALFKKDNKKGKHCKKTSKWTFSLNSKIFCRDKKKKVRFVFFSFYASTKVFKKKVQTIPLFYVII